MGNWRSQIKVFMLGFTWLSLVIIARAQVNTAKLPVFKQITHPFMPPITSETFYFTSDGLIWFSTGQGLTSFDGTDIVYHSTLQQSNQMGLARVGAMVEDSLHNIYVVGGNNIIYYNRKDRTLTSLELAIPGDTLKHQLPFASLYIDQHGLLYAGLIGRGFFIYDPTTRKSEHINLDASMPSYWENRLLNTVSSVVPSQSDPNRLWIGTFHGIYSFDINTKKLSRNFKVINLGFHKYMAQISADSTWIDIQKMVAEGDSIIWFNSWAGGFGKYEIATGRAKIVFGRDALYKTKDLFYGYVIPRFERLDDGRILLGIYNGRTALYEPATGGVTYFNVSGLNYQLEQTRFVSKDRAGNVWLLQRGLLYTSVPSNRRLQEVDVPIQSPIKFNLPQLRGIYYDIADSSFYCAVMGSTGVHVYDTNFKLKKILPTALIDNYYAVGSSIDVKIAKDGVNRFWTAGWKCFVKDPDEKKFTPVEKKFPQLSWLGKENMLLSVLATRDGDMLCKTMDGVIFQVNHNTLAVDTIRCPQIQNPGAEIKDFTAWYDSLRNLVYLSGGEGVARYDLSKKKMQIIPGKSLYGAMPVRQGICSPTLDAAGRLWLAIPKYGVRIIDPETLLCVDSIEYGERGLIRGDYTAVYGAPGKKMLFRSQNGIAVYDYGKNQSFLFDNSNGLKSPDNESLLYCHGMMFIGYRGWFDYFRLSDLDNYSATAHPYVSTIYANEVKIYSRAGEESPDPIRLAHDQNTLTITFSSTEFIFPERIAYAYQLLPVEKEWTYTDYFNRKIVYAKLPPGTYTFRLRSQIQGGSWDMKPLEYTITIVPAWWQTTSLKVAVFIIAILLALVLVQWWIRTVRTSEQNRIRREKEMLELEAKALRAQMNPHFIFNSLNSIKSLINKNENDKAAQYLTTFSKLIRTLFQNSDRREINLFEELETCKLYTQLERMRFGDKVNFIFEISDTLDLKSIRVPALILQPFIENAIWHGLVPKEEGGKVIVTVRETQQGIECKIDDDGIGREMSRQYKGQYEATHESKGIGLTQSRIHLDRLLNDREDTISIIDKQDEVGQSLGTTVIITFNNLS